jgi:D-citramalate synthase
MKKKIIVESYVLSHAKGLRPSTTLCLKNRWEVIEEHKEMDNLMLL